MKSHNPANQSTSANKRYTFSFEGGDDLTTMGASWFISYLYHIEIDSNHRNWEAPKTKHNRISVFVHTEQKLTSKGISMHRHYVEQICSMSPILLSKNKIGIHGERVIDMAQELLNRMASHP